MKTHKIRNVDKSVCVAEQAIAYNIAFSQHINFRKEDNDPEQDTKRALDFIRKCVIGSISPSKANADLVLKILESNLESYFKNFFITDSYKTVSEHFPLPIE